MTSASQTPGEPTELEALVALAQGEQRAGRLAEAAAAYRKVLALRPHAADAYNSLGHVLVGLGKLDEAAAEYERALALNPGLFQTYNNLGNILHLQGAPERAMARYEQALALRPDYAPAHANLGNILRDQGQLDKAASRYRQAIALRPDLIEAHNNLGALLRQQGNLDEAAAHFRQAVAVKPDHLEAHFSLGDILHQQGQLDEAAASYRQVLALRPDLAEAHHNLGNVLKQQGKLDEAAAAYRQTLVFKPGFFPTLVNLAAIFQEQEKLDEAAASYRQAIAVAPVPAPQQDAQASPPPAGPAHAEPPASVAPDLYQAYRGLGCVLQAQRKLDEAVDCFRQAVALRPNLAEAHQALGNVLMDHEKPNEARPAYEQAVQLDPGLEQAHQSLGCIYQEQGDLDRSLASFHRALALNPNFFEAHHNLGNALRQLGRFQEAAEAYERSLDLQPDFVEAHFHRSELKTFRAGDPDLAALEALAKNEDLPADKMVFVHFALGKALEDVGDYSGAFQHWLKGNALRRREIDYNQAATQRTFRLVAETFDEEFLARFEGAGDPSPAPIFIVGMPRSGSTLVEQILACHPQIHAAGELDNLDVIVRSEVDATGRRIPFPQCIAALDADGFRRLGQAYLASLPPHAAGTIRITDKAPGNFFRAGMIRLMLPHARIIHTMRDPVDTCVSCFARFFNTIPFSYDLAELGCYYRWYHELMEHWRSVLPDEFMLDVVYEEVVDNLEEQARRLIDFCGLPWDDRCLSFHKSRRPVATSSNVQVRRPIYRSSVERWRRYEAFLEPLLAELESCRQPQ